MTSTRHGAAQLEALIVGGGPTGLTPAKELARYGVAFRIVDKAPYLSQHTKARGVQARTLERATTEEPGLLDLPAAVGA
jgi:2-polyprenyl-6-methoxyphenol hydroxylase-like FAD-dependent oxidoreductase